ncbi:hypothetical protein LTR41_002436 [Exophiala xenobiotica]|nr:hypothetical protein LTR41_002436 [Exophiala xenobiotica]
MSIQNIVSLSQPATGLFLGEATSLMDVILEAVRIFHQFSKYPHGVPRAVHTRILQTLGKGDPEGMVASSLNQWSDGSLWIQALEMGASENQRMATLNMLEYMGAWEWYEKQIELSLTIIRTKKNKPVGRRGAAIHVLNEMELLLAYSERPGTWLSSIGRIGLQEEECGSDH